MVTEHVVGALRPMIGTLQYSRGVPVGFWNDDYVLGFLGFLITFHGSVTSGRKLSTEDKGQVLFDAFTALSNMNGKAIGQRFTELAKAPSKSQDFEEGADNASACAFVSIGKVSDHSQPIYERAKQIAAEQGKPDDLSAVVAVMMHELWFEKIRQRFPIHT